MYMGQFEFFSQLSSDLPLSLMCYTIMQKTEKEVNSMLLTHTKQYGPRGLEFVHIGLGNLCHINNAKSQRES